jgi:hypothetical protein
MAQSRTELKLQMMCEAEKLIDRILAEKKPTSEIKLGDIERMAVEAGKRFQEMVAETLVKDSQGDTSVIPKCPGCGEEMAMKGYRKRRVVTEAGEVELERAYYYCAKCRRGFFPLDERWGLTRSIYSPERAKQIVWLSGLLPYEQAEEVFERIGHCRIPATSIWRQSQEYGERLKTHVEQSQEVVRVERTVLPPVGCDHRRRKGISMDGGKLHLRGEGWKEFKVGTVFDIEQRPGRDAVTDEVTDQARGVNIDYHAVIGSAEALGPGLWALAVRRAVPSAADSVVVADGAEWIWKLADNYFPDSVQIVDWFHACEHLNGAAIALYPHDVRAAERWFKRRRENLFKGEVHVITSWLENSGLADKAGYFHKHKRRMRYQEFREEGYPIGSGTVESAIKQFKARLTGPGMRWSRPNAERMLIIRTAVLNHTFDQLWQTVT